MANQSRHSSRVQAEPEIGYYEADRLEPGEYPAYCRSASVYKDRMYQRWQCALQFDVLAENLTDKLGRVTLFMNLGSRERAHAGRRGKFWAAFNQANGGPLPRKDRLPYRVFEKRMARIQVGDVTRDFRGQEIEATYSVVRKIISWETGPRNQLTNQPRTAADIYKQPKEMHSGFGN